MASLHSALKLNNQAVALYHSNDLNQAAESYYQSICVINTLLNECDDQERTGHVEALTTCSFSNSRRNDEPFVYQGALIFQESPPSPLSALQNMTGAMTVYSAGILFNAAVLNHQVAIKTGKSRPLDLATQLYETSLHLIGNLRGEANHPVSLIAIAATNNLAQIELAKGLLLHGCKRLRVLKSLIHELYHMATDMLSSDELQSILANTLSAPNGMISSPAA